MGDEITLLLAEAMPGNELRITPPEPGPEADKLLLPLFKQGVISSYERHGEDYLVVRGDKDTPEIAEIKRVVQFATRCLALVEETAAGAVFSMRPDAHVPAERVRSVFEQIKANGFVVNYEIYADGEVRAERSDKPAVF